MKHTYTLPILLLVFVVLTAGIVAAGGLLYRSQRESCKVEGVRVLHSVADLKVSELSLWRKERLADTSVFYKPGLFTRPSRFVEAHENEVLAATEMVIGGASRGRG
ncbi:MAG: hypothetical protein ACYC0Y_26755, partial [Pirellulales bacterium]